MPPEVNPLTHSFVPVAFMIFMSVMTGVGMLVLSWFLGQGRTSHAHETVYECGLDPMDAQNKRFPVKFYVVAMLFILFDVEIALLVPWAVYFGAKHATPDMRLIAFVDLLVFAAILVVGYVYLYKAGAFDWVDQVRGQRRGGSAAAARQRRAA
jgi:NADH-quinone oxidoreductase subunit A